VVLACATVVTIDAASIPVNSTWANLAWGFSAGGNDTVTTDTYVGASFDLVFD